LNDRHLATGSEIYSGDDEGGSGAVIAKAVARAAHAAPTAIGIV
jgi:hypothetical protein